jgi:hypothetical protein
MVNRVKQMVSVIDEMKSPVKQLLDSLMMDGFCNTVVKLVFIVWFDMILCFGTGRLICPG